MSSPEASPSGNGCFESQYVLGGPVSKWTNILKGWQNRFLVLDRAAQTLYYYTSEENYKLDERRGAVRLRGSVIGIDDDDDCMFTVTTKDKAFHFRARDAGQCERWTQSIQKVLDSHQYLAEAINICGSATGSRRIAEVDGYLQLFLTHISNIEVRINNTSGEERDKAVLIMKDAKRFAEAVKYAILSLQLEKSLKDKSTDAISITNEGSASEESHHPKVREFRLTLPNKIEQMKVYRRRLFDRQAWTEDDIARLPGILRSLCFGVGHSLDSWLQNFVLSTRPLRPSANGTAAKGCPSRSTSDTNLTEKAIPDIIFGGAVPSVSYSSSEDNDISDSECYFDALDEEATPAGGDPDGDRTGQSACTKHPFEVYDACYDHDGDEDPQEIVDCSIFIHLLSQVKLGMDLTRVTLPTFILERRSFLEMIADFLAHPDLFVSPAAVDSPKDRFISVVRWYLSAFHAGRRSVVPKKPYNPILGEIFQCYYALPDEKKSDLVTNGPVPWAGKSDVSFVAEQVSHHPPVSAYYAECVDRQIEIEGWIWTKSRFLGLSVGVNMVGVTTLRLLKLNEEYTMTFPSAYGRSILSIPWFELGGKVCIECKQTGFRCDCDFLTKPFYGGKKHRVVGTITGPDGRCLYNIEGEWNGRIELIENDPPDHTTTLFDVSDSPTVAKIVKPIRDQQENESRRLWKDVTYHLKHGHVDRATDAKRLLEDKQRKDAAYRAETGTKWIPKFFKPLTDNPASGWTYANRLSGR